MVRLEALTARRGASVRPVSIPIWCDWKGNATPPDLITMVVSIPIWCDWKAGLFYFVAFPAVFQFLYGAIGRCRLQNRQGWNTGFNSYMVRLEVCLFSNSLNDASVSIPIWCDWKLPTNQRVLKFRVFQFLYGAIGRIVFNDQFASFRCFNSYMVRLEVNIAQYRFHRRRVSIPIWCDWKRVAIVSVTPETKFQFLYGAIGSDRRRCTWIWISCFNSYMVRLEEGTLYFPSAAFTVSIPIWCDWKGPCSCRRIALSRVSIPIWCDWKVAIPACVVAMPAVSIPIWCDWKRPHLPNTVDRSVFQFLYGAIGS